MGVMSGVAARSSAATHISFRSSSSVSSGSLSDVCTGTGREAEELGLPNTLLLGVVCREEAVGLGVALARPLEAVRPLWMVRNFIIVSLAIHLYLQ